VTSLFTAETQRTQRNKPKTQRSLRPVPRCSAGLCGGFPPLPEQSAVVMLVPGQQRRALVALPLLWCEHASTVAQVWQPATFRQGPARCHGAACHCRAAVLCAGHRHRGQRPDAPDHTDANAPALRCHGHARRSGGHDNSQSHTDGNSHGAPGDYHS